MPFNSAQKKKEERKKKIQITEECLCKKMLKLVECKVIFKVSTKEV